MRCVYLKGTAHVSGCLTLIQLFLPEICTPERLGFSALPCVHVFTCVHPVSAPVQVEIAGFLPGRTLFCSNVIGDLVSVYLMRSYP